MSSTYTGDALGTPIAPDPGQAPGAAPVLLLPADGEAANVASIMQPLKTLANRIAWLLTPRGKASDYTTDILPFANSLGQTIDRVDALGLVRGSHYYREDWPINFTEHANTGTDYLPFGLRTGGVASNSSQVLPGWFWGNLTDGSYSATELVQLQDPYVLSGRIYSPRRFMLTTPPSIPACASGIYRRPHLSFAKNALYSLSFRITYLLSAGPVIVGLASSGTGYFVGAVDYPGGIYLRYDAAAGDTTWKIVTRAVGGASAVIDTGVTPSVDGVRVRIVYRGSELDDAGTTRAAVYLDNYAPVIASSSLPADGEVFSEFAAHVYTTTPGFATASWLGVGDVEFQSYWLP